MGLPSHKFGTLLSEQQKSKEDLYTVLVIKYILVIPY